MYLHLGKILNEQVPIWNGQKGIRILTKKSAFEYMPVTDSCPISANLNKQITLVSNSNYFLKIPRSSTCRLTVFCWLLSLVNRLYAVIHKMQKSKTKVLPCVTVSKWYFRGCYQNLRLINGRFLTISDHFLPTTLLS